MLALVLFKANPKVLRFKTTAFSKASEAKLISDGFLRLTLVENSICQSDRMRTSLYVKKCTFLLYNITFYHRYTIHVW